MTLSRSAIRWSTIDGVAAPPAVRRHGAELEHRVRVGELLLGREARGVAAADQRPDLVQVEAGRGRDDDPHEPVGADEYEGLADLVRRDSECRRLVGGGLGVRCDMSVAARIVVSFRLSAAILAARLGGLGDPRSAGAGFPGGASSAAPTPDRGRCAR